MSDSFRRKINDICQKLPGAEWSDPWGGGHDAWKVGDKMFACMGSRDVGVSVKCADIESASLLKEMGIAENAPYFHKSWVRLNEASPEDELRIRIIHSYDLVRSKLPLKIRKDLPDRPSDAALDAVIEERV